jgi:two-component system LytT family response regulator
MSPGMPAHQYYQTADSPEPPAHQKRIGDASPVCYKGSEPWRSGMGLKTLIVDDEPIARKVLREELDSMADIEVVGEADNGVAALDLIAGRQPDLVLLDLQMPEMGGFEVIRKIRHGTNLPVVVIVTAYDKYALEAFEAGAIDYLLKPVGRDRLTEAIERARRLTGQEAVERLARLQEIAEPLLPGQRLKKIVGKAGAEYFLLDANEVFAFHAEGDIVWITTARRRYQATQTLKVLEERLRDTSFQRIHRNALVNVDHVRKMSALSSQRWLITLINDKEFIASKRQARGIRRLVNW